MPRRYGTSIQPHSRPKVTDARWETNTLEPVSFKEGLHLPSLRGDSTKMRAAPATLAVVGVVVALSLLAFGGLFREHSSVPKNPTVTENGVVVFVGSESGFAGETSAILKSRFSGPTVEVTELANLSAAATRVNGSSVVVFNSDWLTGKVGAVALTDFFKAILPSQVKLVARPRCSSMRSNGRGMESLPRGGIPRTITRRSRATSSSRQPVGTAPSTTAIRFLLAWNRMPTVPRILSRTGRRPVRTPASLATSARFSP